VTAVLDSTTATLSDCTLASLPLRETAAMPGIEHDHTPALVQHRLPGVELDGPRTISSTRREYWFSDSRTGSRLRLVLIYEPARGDVRCHAAESGPRSILAGLRSAFEAWTRRGRRHPARWDAP